MHHLVQLDGHQVVDLRNAGIDHHLRIARNGHGAFQHLRHELFHQVLAALAGSRLYAKAAFFHDLIEQALLLNLFASSRASLYALRLSHWNRLPFPFPSHP